MAGHLGEGRIVGHGDDILHDRIGGPVLPLQVRQLVRVLRGVRAGQEGVGRLARVKEEKDVTERLPADLDETELALPPVRGDEELVVSLVGHVATARLEGDVLMGSEERAGGPRRSRSHTSYSRVQSSGRGTCFVDI